MGQALRDLDPRSSAASAFGAKLRDLRLKSHQSLRVLGNAVLVSGDLLGKIEKAQRRPHPELVQRLDQALGAQGELVHLAMGFIEMPARADLPVLDALTPDLAEEQLRRLITRVRNADHKMAADSLDEVTGFANAALSLTPRTPAQRRETLLRAVTEAQQLAGWMLFDKGRCKSAGLMFSRARVSAERAGALDLAAFIGGPNAAFMSTWTGDPARGAEQAYGALAWAYRSGNRRLAAFVAAIAARAHARLGESELCRKMLSTAEFELSCHHATDADPDWLAVFESSALAGHTGSCMLDLGDPRRALAAFQEQEYASPARFVRNNLIWQLERADANLRLGDAECAAAAIAQVLDYAECAPVTARVVRVMRTLDQRLHKEVRANSPLAETRARLCHFIAYYG